MDGNVSSAPAGAISASRVPVRSFHPLVLVIFRHRTLGALLNRQSLSSFLPR